MGHSFLTRDIESFYFLIGLLVSVGFELDFEYMRHYQDMHKDEFLILVKEDLNVL